VVKTHNRFVTVSLGIYFLCVVGLSWFLYHGPLKQAFSDKVFVDMLEEQIGRDPLNAVLWEKLAMIYHRQENYQKAIRTYEQVIQMNPLHSVALNNLAWLFVTCPEPGLRNEARALTLAKKAVALERSAIYLDTLAEAYYANGFIHSAIKTIKEAEKAATRNKGYYKKQLKRFLAGSVKK
jgi:tetratricopeptide (TPR) repeat protein